MHVAMVDGTRYELKIMPGDVVRTERNFGVTASTMDKDPALEHILYMGWVASKRHEYGGTFDDWCDQVEDIDVQTGEAINPSSTAP